MEECTSQQDNDCQSQTHDNNDETMREPRSDQQTNHGEMKTRALPQSDENQNKFKCYFCNRHFKFRKLVESHINRVHFKLKRFSCSKCDASFANRSSVSQHMNAVHHQRKFPCSVCQKAFSYKCILKRHMDEIHLKPKQFSCTKCDVSFSQKSNLTKHMKSQKHRNGKQEIFKCSFCQKSFSSKWNGIRHVRTVHLGLKLYPRTKKSIACSICSKQFTNLSNVKRHMSTVHHKQIAYKCSLCDMFFSQNCTRNRHMRNIHHKSQKQLSVISTYPWVDACQNKIESHYLMDNCVEVQNKSVSLDDNYIQVQTESTFQQTEGEIKGKLPSHQGTDKKSASQIEDIEEKSPYQKDFDEIRQISPSQMDKNGKTKTKFSPETNNNDEFRKSSQLKSGDNIADGKFLKFQSKNHMNRVHKKRMDKDHQTQKLYSCSFCQKAFSRKWNFEKHVRTIHIGLQHSPHTIKCIPCTMCLKGFTSLSNARKHMWIVHQKQRSGYYKCSSCDMVFSQTSSLGHHIRNIHDKNKKQLSKTSPFSHMYACQIETESHFHLDNYGKSKSPEHENVKDRTTLPDHSLIYGHHFYESDFPSLYVITQPEVNTKIADLRLNNRLLTSSTSCNSDRDILNSEINEISPPLQDNGEKSQIQKDNGEKSSSLLDFSEINQKCQSQKEDSRDTMAKSPPQRSNVNKIKTGSKPQSGDNTSTKKSSFKCPICRKSYTLRADVERHIDEEHFNLNTAHENFIECSICAQKFRSKDQAFEHMNKNHNSTQCSLCLKEFACGSKLDEHMEAAHFRQISYKCTLCDMLFSQNSSRNRHIKNIHGKNRKRERKIVNKNQKQIEIKLPPLQVNSTCEIKTDLDFELNKNEPGSMCQHGDIFDIAHKTICQENENINKTDFSAQQDKNRKREREIVNKNQKQIDIKLPPLQVDSTREIKTDLDFELNKNEIQPESMCQHGDIFDIAQETICQENENINKTDVEAHKENKNEPDEIKMECPEAKSGKVNGESPLQRNVISEMKSESPTREGEKIIEIKPIFPDDMHNDSGIKGQSLSSISQLRNGETQLPIADKIMCPHCQKQLTSIADLIRHITEIHPKQNPFVCAVCNQSFSHRQTLREHFKAIHSGESKFRCFTCKKLFTRKSNLNSHVRKVHLKQKVKKVITCAICQASFTAKSSLITHINRFHPQQSFECSKPDSNAAPNVETVPVVQMSPDPTLNHSSTGPNPNIDTATPNAGTVPEVPALSGSALNQMETNKKLNKRSECCMGEKPNGESPFQLNVISEKKLEPPTQDNEEIIEIKPIAPHYTGRNSEMKGHSLSSISQLRNGEVKLPIVDKIKCPHCQKQLISIADLIRHVTEVHPKQNPFICAVCNQSFSHRQTLREHFKEIHSGGSKFRCFVCEMLFTRKSNLNSHVRKVHLEQKVKKEFTCGICQASFTTKSNLTVHFKAIHSKETKLRCFACERLFTYRSNLSAHVRRVHLKQKVRKEITCAICRTSFATKSNLSIHIKRFHPVQSFGYSKSNPNAAPNLETVPVVQMSPDPMLNHSSTGPNSNIDTATPNAVSVPEVPAQSGSALNQMETNTQLIECSESKMGEKVNGEPPFQLNAISEIKLESPTQNNEKIIEIKPIAPQYTDSEIKRHSLSSISQLRNGDIHLTTVEKIKCPHCQKQLTSIAYLIRHVTEVHPKQNPFVCAICNQAFSHRQTLKEHFKAIHSRESKFRCFVCEMLFTRKSNLYSHVRKVHLIQKVKKEITCGICRASFTTKSNLTVHFKAIHSRESELRCFVCERLFTYRSNLNSHVRRVHLKQKVRKEITCAICRASFATKSNLSIHINRFHPVQSFGYSKPNPNAAPNVETVPVVVPISPDPTLYHSSTGPNPDTATPNAVTINRFHPEQSFECSKPNPNAAPNVETVPVVPISPDPTFNHSSTGPNPNTVQEVPAPSDSALNQMETNTKSKPNPNDAPSVETVPVVQMSPDPTLNHSSICPNPNTDTATPNTVSVPAPSGSELNQMETNKKLIKCSECHKIFSNRNSLKRHIRRIHGGLSFKCPKCEKILGTKYSLSQHIEAQHKGRVQTFNCDRCPKTFKSKTGLSLHINKHDGKTNYTCAYCNATFISKHAYDAHVYQHTKEALYSCKKCGKGFPINPSLCGHVKICGLNERKFKCRLCGKHFKTENILKEHNIHKHQNTDKLQCSKCGKLLSHRASLYTHSKICKK